MRFGDLATALCGVAARHLGWRPDAFWRATPAELLAALCPRDDTPAPLDRAALQRMMEHDDG